MGDTVCCQVQLSDIRQIFARDRKALQAALNAAQSAVSEATEAQKRAEMQLLKERQRNRELEEQMLEQSAMFEFALSDISSKEQMVVPKASMRALCVRH